MELKFCVLLIELTDNMREFNVCDKSAFIIFFGVEDYCREPDLYICSIYLIDDIIVFLDS